MKSVKLAILALCAGFSAYAGEATDNTPPTTAKNRDWQSSLAGPGLIGGGYGLIRQHYNAMEKRMELARARAVEGQYVFRGEGSPLSPLYYKNVARFLPAENYITARVPLMGGALMGYGALMLYRWYDNNIRNYHYPTKR